MRIDAKYCSTRCSQNASATRVYRGNRARANAELAKVRRRIKLETIEADRGKCACERCGESDPDKLSIDHVHNDGARHRREVGAGYGFYLWLRRRGYPQVDYRLLCYNCNVGRANNKGVCPHVEVVDEVVGPACELCGGERGKWRRICPECLDGLRRQYEPLKSIANCLTCGASIRQAPSTRTIFFCSDCRSRQDARMRRWQHSQLRIEVFTYYSRGAPTCTGCGETNHQFLTIDHVAGDGAEHRRQYGLKSFQVYQWLKRSHFPEGFQVLCWNCNMKKRDTIDRAAASRVRDSSRPWTTLDGLRCLLCQEDIETVSDRLLHRRRHMAVDVQRDLDLRVPRRSLTTFGFWPSASRSVAWVWRRSWKRMRLSLAASVMPGNAWLSTLGLRGEPFSSAHTQSPSS